ncbi:RND family transporter [Mycolicibacterium brumae]|uniref:MMPL family RND transporter n=1 Tax=Mycolicibacterium brumae TaxID=85968 RepID=A0A2G5P6J0_9MYCO|nr:RND family transporter [Mycolicibacterium brumae]MCV7193809.1 RND family transporter [Mycolicibacterium brumae]PIB73988.1 MMPL family RND transporter [Mycolicibacterium brumae]RWA21431.1 hypothetical protein MBRU_14550 [Mycolicibacterium brumae DSM 44177]UWW07360.1 RND family transporter [Mycolicibacterium brumae]
MLRIAPSPDGSRATRYAPLALICWLIAAGLGNALAPQLERVVETHSRAFMPDDAPSTAAAARSAELMGGGGGDNLNHLVLERDGGLTPDDRAYYDRVVDALRDDESVAAVTDLWSDPITEQAAVSADGEAAYVMVRLAGELGTARAGEAVTKLRDTATGLSPPAGLNVYVTGPGATIADEFRAIDRQMLAITGVTVALIMILLLIVYRSVVTALIPLLSVGVALGVARPIVAVLGEADLVEVSLFSVALLAALMLGAGTDYGIFLIGRYHEGRRAGLPPAEAQREAFRRVAPVIAGSALTVAIALAVLSLAEIGNLRSAGIPSAIGILVAMAASLTLTPALLAIAVRFGFAEPRAGRGIARRWRRIGTTVVRWPGPVLAASGALVAVLTLPLIGMRIGWDEPAATPADLESSRGYAAMDRHFPLNQLLPAVVTIGAEVDLRNPAGLIAIERIARQLMEIPDVTLVQAASRPTGVVPEEATLTNQVGRIGSELGASITELTARLDAAGDLSSTLTGLRGVLTGMRSDLQVSNGGFDEISSAATDMQSGMTSLRDNVVNVSGNLDPLRNFIAGTPNCAANPLCSAADRVVTPVDQLIASSNDLASGAEKLTGGSQSAGAALKTMPGALDSMSASLDQARSATQELSGLSAQLVPALNQVVDYLTELSDQFAGSGAGGFYLPERALADPRFATALDALMSKDGRATTMLVYGDGAEWSAVGAARAAEIEQAVRQATKEGILTGADVELAGVGPATRDLQVLYADDLRLLVGVTLALIFAVVALMLRSPVAALVVVGTVAVSYAAALGTSVFVWQHLLGHELHWAAPAISLIALVAVGADYNLLLAMRMREELPAGMATGTIRAFAGTGSVVTTAGLVFGLTMAALLGSSVLSIAQIGSTIAVGLLVDTLVIRTYVMPAAAMLLGRWFWWPRAATRRARSAL